jgi:putative membrane protein
MRQIQQILSDQELEHLAGVIAEQERATSGEIRLMIVGRSIQTGHVFPMVFLALFSFCLLLIWFERHQLILVAGWWTLPAIFLITLLASWILSRLDLVKRGLTVHEDLVRQVWNRAELEFHREGMGRTSGQTGILLFLSLLERRAVVLGDRAIHEKLNEEAWRAVIEKILEGPRTGQWAAKLGEALELCGGLLSRHFPIQEGDRDELPNHVIIKP